MRRRLSPTDRLFLRILVLTVMIPCSRTHELISFQDLLKNEDALLFTFKSGDSLDKNHRIGKRNLTSLHMNLHEVQIDCGYCNTFSVLFKGTIKKKSSTYFS